jgi:hypothetical protein
MNVINLCNAKYFKLPSSTIQFGQTDSSILGRREERGQTA